ncbi:MAG: phage regulatory CII family protein [Ignavibacteriaceae bacterium]
MTLNRTIKTVLYRTIHRNKKSVEQIADEMGISSSYLYRAGLPTDESGVKFPVEHITPLIRATKDNSILEHLAMLNGFILVKVPKYKNSKVDEIDMVDEYQEATTKALRSLREFLNKPDARNYELVEAALREVMSRSASAQRYVDKRMAGQIEMEL